MRVVLAIVLLFALALGVIVRAMASTAHFDPEPIHDGFRSPIVALELVTDSLGVSKILRDPTGDRNREVIRTQIGADWCLIPTYWVFFAGLGLLQDRSRRPLARRLGPAVCCLITLAALFDVQENLAILRALECPWPDLPDAAALAIRQPSLIKWASFFAATALSSLLFLGRRGDRGLLRLLAPLSGLLFLAAGLVGTFGIAFNSLIEIATLILAPGVALVILLFAFLPRPFLSNL